MNEHTTTTIPAYCDGDLVRHRVSAVGRIARGSCCYGKQKRKLIKRQKKSGSELLRKDGSDRILQIFFDI